MNNFYKLLFFLALQLLPLWAYAQPISLNAVRYVNLKDQSRLLFDVSRNPSYRVFVLNNPPRLVIDVKEGQAGKKLSQPPSSHPLFANVRTAGQADKLRIVVDLKQAISAKQFTLKTNNKQNQRLIVDLMGKPTSVVNTASPAAEDKLQALIAEVSKQKHTNTKSERKTAINQQHKQRGRKVIVAVDAGHGGEDPGAHGPKGTLEKYVTFAIAKKLKAFIDAEPGMKAVMVRKGDYYVDLRKRMSIARSMKADLFVSIHADAVQDTSVKGASVYTLSTKGASSEAARWLANAENASDLIGGVSLDDKENTLASVLLDLSQTATQEASNNVASKVLKNFQTIGHIHKSAVQQAGFMVLKSPDIPSILVETAFISNPSEELNLLSERYQNKIAAAIFRGIVNYFRNANPDNSKIAAL
jgi:N-acetylmuramoyl-L-alanine amidase